MITRGDAKGLAMWGLAGCVAGICFHASNLYIDRKYDHTLDDVESTWLRKDKGLLMHVYNLQAYSDINGAAFKAAVTSMDHFLGTEELAQDKTQETKTSADCRIEAYLYYKKALDCLKDLYESSKGQDSAQKQASVYRIISKIFPILHEHWKSVMKLTS